MRRWTAVLLVLAGCATGLSSIPNAWRSVAEAPHPGPIPVTGEKGGIHLAGARLFNGDKALTDDFAAIDSFDFSASRGEVVFSARRKDRDNFDVGLVSSDGSPISWIPSADPADEVAVQWAPRGNKVSYIVRAKGGDAVRTVHIPTATQITNAFPNATICSLTWDAGAEHYTVAYSTPDASERVEVMKYDGTSRKMTVPPAVTIDAEVEPFAKDAILLKPRDIEYAERLPLAVWVANDFAWSDARAALMKNARGAIIVTTRTPDADLWKRVNETNWLDATHAIIVDPQQQPATSNQQQITITTNATLTDKYKRTGNTIEVPPSVIQSFAAGFIADQWKRTPPAHGSSR